MQILILLLLSITIFCECKRNKYECWQKGLKPENLNVKKRNKCTVTKLTDFLKPTGKIIIDCFILKLKSTSKTTFGYQCLIENTIWFCKNLINSSLN